MNKQNQKEEDFFIEDCPFCSSSETKVKNQGEYWTGFWVECCDCKAQSGEYVNREEAVESWNRRD